MNLSNTKGLQTSNGNAFRVIMSGGQTFRKTPVKLEEQSPGWVGMCAGKQHFRQIYCGIT